MNTVAEKSAITELHGLNFIWLEITGKCNLACTHCYADSGPLGSLYGSMSDRDWTEAIDQARELGCRQVQFIGGEPTIHPHLLDLVDHANYRGFEFIEVFTNATRLSPKLIRCFQRNRVHVATSFYSEDPQTHERITQGKGSWSRTVTGIKNLLAVDLPLRVGIIETEQNVGHAQRAKVFLKRLGVQQIGVDRQRGVGRGDRIQLGTMRERYNELCGQCWKGKLCVTPSGDCFPCVFSRATCLGNAKLGLRSILVSEKLLQFREIMREVQTTQIHTVADFLPGESAQCRPDTACNPCEPTSCFPSLCGPDQPSDPGCMPRDCGPPCGPQCSPNWR